MQERAERIGASLTIVTAPRAGTEVVLAWEPPSFSIPVRDHVSPVEVDAASRRRRQLRASVLIADDHALLRTGVANIINQEPGLLRGGRSGQRRRSRRGVRALSSRRHAARSAHAGDGRRRSGQADSRPRPAGQGHHPDDLRHRRGHHARAESRREGVHPEGHLSGGTDHVHPRCAGRQDLPGACRRGQARRRRDARCTSRRER